MNLKNNIINVLIDSSPLQTGHAVRGIGSYTRYLCDALEHFSIVSVQRSANSLPNFSPDLIHYPFFDLFKPSLPLLKKKPIVVTIHDVIPLIFPKFYPTGVKAKFSFKKQQLSLKGVSQIITDSNASKVDIINYLSFPEEKITVIPLAPNPFLKIPSSSEISFIKNKYKLPEKYLLYVGDINYNKNIPQLIKSLKFLPQDINLVLVGKNFIPQDIPEWKWIETQIALSNVSNKIRFITDLTSDSNAELSTIYSQAIAYVQPSLYEGFGLPILEAMRCKVPVISSNKSSLTEVGGNYSLYTEPEAEFFAEEINNMLNWSRTYRQEVINQAFKWSNNFSWKKTASLTIEVYKKALSQ